MSGTGIYPPGIIEAAVRRGRESLIRRHIVADVVEAVSTNAPGYLKFTGTSTALLPALTFTVDNDTGVYRDSTDGTACFTDDALGIACFKYTDYGVFDEASINPSGQLHLGSSTATGQQTVAIDTTSTGSVVYRTGGALEWTVREPAAFVHNSGAVSPGTVTQIENGVIHRVTNVHNLVDADYTPASADEVVGGDLFLVPTPSPLTAQRNFNLPSAADIADAAAVIADPLNHGTNWELTIDNTAAVDPTHRRVIVPGAGVTFLGLDTIDAGEAATLLFIVTNRFTGTEAVTVIRLVPVDERLQELYDASVPSPNPSVTLSNANGSFSIQCDPGNSVEPVFAVYDSAGDYMMSATGNTGVVPFPWATWFCSGGGSLGKRGAGAWYSTYVGHGLVESGTDSCDYTVAVRGGSSTGQTLDLGEKSTGLTIVQTGNTTASYTVSDFPEAHRNSTYLVSGDTVFPSGATAAGDHERNVIVVGDAESSQVMFGGKNSVLVGSSTCHVDSDDSVVVGHQAGATAAALQSVSVGASSLVGAVGATAVGYGSQANGDYATLIGSSSSVTNGLESTVIGASCLIEGQYTTGCGFSCLSPVPGVGQSDDYTTYVGFTGGVAPTGNCDGMTTVCFSGANRDDGAWSTAIGRLAACTGATVGAGYNVSVGNECGPYDAYPVDRSTTIGRRMPASEDAVIVAVYRAGGQLSVEQSFPEGVMMSNKFTNPHSFIRGSNNVCLSGFHDAPTAGVTYAGSDTVAIGTSAVMNNPSGADDLNKLVAIGTLNEYANSDTVQIGGFFSFEGQFTEAVVLGTRVDFARSGAGTATVGTTWLGCANAVNPAAPSLSDYNTLVAPVGNFNLNALDIQQDESIALGFYNATLNTGTAAESALGLQTSLSNTEAATYQAAPGTPSITNQANPERMLRVFVAGAEYGLPLYTVP